MAAPSQPVRRLCQEEHRSFSDTCCHSPGSIQLSSLPAIIEPSTSTPITATTAPGTSSFHFILTIFPPKKIKAIWHNNNFLEDRNSPLSPTLKQICGSYLLAFFQMRSIKTHGLHSLCSWKSHAADNLNKSPQSTIITDTSAAACTPETKDPHSS